MFRHLLWCTAVLFATVAVCHKAVHGPSHLPSRGHDRLPTNSYATHEKAVSLNNSAYSQTSTAEQCNTASDRSTWCDGFSIDTDYYSEAPYTGRTVEYWFEITGVEVAPDGYSRYAQAINGSIPGPTIEAHWGDEVVVHLTNSLETNGSSIHFHGVRQNWTNGHDGVPSVTQCPIAPGDSTTYRWRATQYGSSWYHSHFALQAWEGAFGPILIHGPATAEYENDLGHIMLSDWSHQTADELYTYAETSGPPTLDTGLINGVNVLPGDDSQGSRYNVSIEAGSTNLMRLVNTAIDTHFDFMVDNHTLQVVAMDFVPIVPYTTTSLSIGMGQRYDVIITADQSSVASNFWIRAIPDVYCSENDNTADIRGILHYNSSTSTPNTTAWTYTETSCTGEDSADMVPYLSLDASSTFISSNESNVTVAYNTDNVYKWYLNEESFLMEWGSPTSLSIMNGASALSFDSEAGVVSLPTADDWFVLVIQTTLSVPHPIHLHGHDFFVLGSGTGVYNSSIALNYANPPRRDVAMLPGDGYLVMSIKTDNPGVWLCHCHIGWHTEEGFALQLIERYSEIAGLYSDTTVEETCKTWTAYQAESDTVQDDSGI